MTTAGIFGTIVDEDEDEGTVIVEIAPGTRIKMIRAASLAASTKTTSTRKTTSTKNVDEDAAPEADDNAEGPVRS